MGSSVAPSLPSPAGRGTRPSPRGRGGGDDSGRILRHAESPEAGAGRWPLEPAPPSTSALPRHGAHPVPQPSTVQGLWSHGGGGVASPVFPQGSPWQSGNKEEGEIHHPVPGLPGVGRSRFPRASSHPSPPSSSAGSSSSAWRAALRWRHCHRVSQAGTRVRPVATAPRARPPTRLDPVPPLTGPAPVAGRTAERGAAGSPGGGPEATLPLRRTPELQVSLHAADMMEYTMDSPRPVGIGPLGGARRARWAGQTSGGIPNPVSDTATRSIRTPSGSVSCPGLEAAWSPPGDGVPGIERQVRRACCTAS